MKKLYSLLFIAVATLGFNAVADTVHFNVNEFDQIVASDAREYVLEKDGVTITVSNGCIYEAFRIYKSETMTVSASYPILSISVYSETEYSEKFGAGNFTTAVGTYEQLEEGSKWGLWTPGNTEVKTVELTASTAQVRATDIEVEVRDNIIASSLNLVQATATGNNKLYSFDLTQTAANVFKGELNPSTLVSTVLPLIMAGQLSLDALCVEVAATASPVAGFLEQQTWGGDSDAPSILPGANPMVNGGTAWSLKGLISQFTGGSYDLDTPIPVTADFNRKVLILGEETTIKGDINGDGSVDGNDVSILLEMVLAGGLTADQIAVADLNGDSDVDGGDVSILLEIVLSGE